MGCSPSTASSAESNPVVVVAVSQEIDSHNQQSHQKQLIQTKVAEAPIAVPSMEGKVIPTVTFKTRGADGGWSDLTTDALFKGKKVILFSLPGAFTPTCSSTHLPTYNALAPVFKANGVDSILCVSVNDTFVMNAWAQGEHVDNVTMIPDGTGAFTEGMGMLRDFGAVGFGKRSWRYSAYIEDGTVKKMFVEPVKEGDPFEVSDAHTMLKHLFPEAKATAAITIFTMPNCTHCARAKKLLKAKNAAFEEVIVDGSTGVTFTTIRAVSGRDTTPQIFIDGKHIGGADDLEKYFV